MAHRLRLPRGLSARLLLLTILFVMVAEVLIYTPSIARFREAWLTEKAAAAHLAALATVDAPEHMVTEDLEREILDHIDAYRVFMTRRDQPMYVLGELPPAPVVDTIDLDAQGTFDLIFGAFDTLANGSGRTALLSAQSPRDADVQIEVIFDETPLVADMWRYSGRILMLSVIIALITASLVFFTVRWLAIRPLTRFTESVLRFRDTPDRDDAAIVPSDRTDEVGYAERALRDMQIAVRSALRQQARLAALGTAMTRINHDLRNMLSSASLVSERLTELDDPEARKAAPRILNAIDRAVELCARTLAFAREEGAPLVTEPVDLHDLVGDAERDLAGARSPNARWINEVPRGLIVAADRAQLSRALVNLGSNAFQAGAERVGLRADVEDDRVVVEVSDDAGGLPPRARAHLFQPFAGSARPGGTGLGLAIAREIVAAHGGALTLARTGADGTVFRISLPRS
ncbi:MAG: HAMP domain-containing histidine kinase [Rhodospirillaceae bacterium]|nr:HAMP domain-containing histidine kinase [Rhodospirillaceae bacterium]